MSPTQFKLVHTGPGALTRRVTFAELPTWFSLASRIESLFRVPIQDVGVSYIDSDGDEITLSTHDELEDYYATMLDGPNDAIKFVVKNLGAIRAQHRWRPPAPPSPAFALGDDGWQRLNIPPLPDMAFFEQPLSAPPPPPPSKSLRSAFVETVDSNSMEEFHNGAASPRPVVVDRSKGREGPLPYASEVEDDASSVVSIIHSDTPIKQPVHVYEFEPDRAFSSDFGLFASGSPRFLSPAQSRSRSLSPSLPARSRSTSRRGIIPSYGSRSRSPVFTSLPKGSRSRSITPKLSSDVRAPPVRVIARPRSRVRVFTSGKPANTSNRSRSRSRTRVTARSRSRSMPRSHNPPIIITVPRQYSPHILPLRDPRPPSPYLPPRPDSPTHAFETADPPTPSAATTSPSLSNDIAGLLNALTNAFATHPELSEGLRNIFKNASQGAYWTAERDAVVNTTWRAAGNARDEAAQAAQRAQEEVGRKVTEALGGILMSLGSLVQPTGEASTRQQNSPGQPSTVIIDPGAGRRVPRPQQQHINEPIIVVGRPRSISPGPPPPCILRCPSPDLSLGRRSTGRSPPIIVLPPAPRSPATVQHVDEDRARSPSRRPFHSPPRSLSPPDYRFLPRSPRARPLPPPGNPYRHFVPPPPPPPSAFPVPPPPLEHHRPHPGRHYSPYPPISILDTPPHGLRRSSTLPNRLGSFGLGPDFPPSVAPLPPVPGEYISSAARKAELEEAKRHYKSKKEEWRREKERRMLEKERRERHRLGKPKQREKMYVPVDYTSEEEISHVPIILPTYMNGSDGQRWRHGERRGGQGMKQRNGPHPTQQEDIHPPKISPPPFPLTPEQVIKPEMISERKLYPRLKPRTTSEKRLLIILRNMGITRYTHPHVEDLAAKYSRKEVDPTKNFHAQYIDPLLEELFAIPVGEPSAASIPEAWGTQ